MQRLWIMVATHFIYDTFNRVWGMFPRHGEVPLYFVARVCKICIAHGSQLHVHTIMV